MRRTPGGPATPAVDPERVIELTHTYCTSAHRASLSAFLVHERRCIMALLSLKSSLHRIRYPFSLSIRDDASGYEISIIEQRTDLQFRLCIPGSEMRISDLDDLIMRPIAPLDTISAVLARMTGRPISLQLSEFETALQSWNAYNVLQDFKDNDLVVPAEYNSVRDALAETGVVWCYNKSCSGKTFLALHSCNTFPHKVVYNPTFSESISLDLVLCLITLGRGCTLLADDIQCNLEEARVVIDCVHSARSRSPTLTTRQVFVFLVSWPEVYGKFAATATAIRAVRVRPEGILPWLRDQLKGPNFERIMAFAGNNLAILHAARKARIPPMATITDIRNAVFDFLVRTSDRQEFEAVYFATVLGAYEFEVPKELLIACTGAKGIDIQNVIRSCKAINGNLFVGHRVLCEFIASYLEQTKRVGNWTREAIVFKYLSRIDQIHLWNRLVQLMADDKSTDSTKVMSIWRLVHGFEAELREQSRKDPSWGREPGSMGFVTRTASLLGILGEYRDVVQAFTSLFRVEDGALRLVVVGCKRAYDRIQELMIEEDAQEPPGNWESGAALDGPRFQENWILGLAAGMGPELTEIGCGSLHQRIVSELRGRQDSASGAWYPRRVPWITARALIGLSRGNPLPKDDVSLQRGIDSLIRSLGDSDHWVPRTGGWNTEHETTALALEAISACQPESAPWPTIERIVRFLKEERATWMAVGNEMDGAIVAHSLVTANHSDEHIIEYLDSLSTRMFPKIVSDTKNFPFRSNQHCMAAQVAFSLVEIGWYLLRQDLPELLRIYLRRAKEEMNRKVFITYSHDSRRHKEKVRRIANHLKSAGFTVFLDESEKAGRNMAQFMQKKIAEADAVILVGTREYKKKAEQEPLRGGVSYEANLLNWLTMSGQGDKIIPVCLDRVWEAGVPVAFQSNKGIHATRISKGCLNEILKAIESQR